MKKHISLLDIFDQQIATKLSDPKKVSKPAFRPSSLGSPCLRKIFYSYNRVLEDFPIPLKVLKICKMGDTIHEMLSEVYRDAGILIDYVDEDGNPVPDKHNPGKFDYEFPIKNEKLESSLKIDGVFNIENELWLGEYKSINEKGFNALTGPKPEHLIQGAFYVHEFNRALNENLFPHIKELENFTKVEGIRFIYVNKNNSNMKEFIVRDSSEIFKQTLIKMLNVKEFCDKSELPPKTKDWCSSCNWRIKCKGNSKGF